MNVLILARWDWSGAGYALMQAVNQHTQHKVRAVSMKRDWIAYPYDILNPGPERLRELIAWSDVLNIHDDGELLIPEGAPSRLIVVTYHGTYYRKQWKRLNRRDKRVGYKATCLTIGLSLYGPLWIGRPIPDLTHVHKPDPNIFKVSHCATRMGKKGTASIVRALRNLPGIELDVAVRVPNKVCLHRRSRCHIVVDRFGPAALGTIGTTAIESWAMGLPVISCASKEGLEAIKSTAGYVPFVAANDAEELRKAVLSFRDDHSFYAMWREAGRRYVVTWHDPKTIAEKFIEFAKG